MLMFARFFPFVLVALLAVPAQAQKPTSDDSSDLVHAADELPELVGGLEGLAQQIQYPAEAKTAGIEGRVFVQFVVDERGGVTNAEVTRGVSPELDAEALRVVRQARFEPGTQRGEPVKVQLTLPISFKLNADRADR